MTTYEIVEQVLEENEKARNDDFLLCIHVYIKMGFAKRLPLGVKIEYKQLDRAPAFETITRIRRLIQNRERRLRASPDVELRRLNREVQMHAFFSTKQSRADTFPGSYLSP